jgi:hypothetical protein
MAEAVFRLADTFLVRQLARETTVCSHQGCPHIGPVHRYWWTEDQCGDPPAGLGAYCSQECWTADQVGPAPSTRPRRWAERSTPGQWDREGIRHDPVRA